MNSYFCYKYFRATDEKVSQKYYNWILKLKKLSICLFLFNFGVIRFNIFSPKEFKSYYKSNKLIENIIYSCLGFHSCIYLISWIYEYYKFKKITLNYNKLR